LCSTRERNRVLYPLSARPKRESGAGGLIAAEIEARRGEVIRSRASSAPPVGLRSSPTERIGVPHSIGTRAARKDGGGAYRARAL
jgi:hypothetical protein